MLICEEQLEIFFFPSDLEKTKKEKTSHTKASDMLKIKTEIVCAPLAPYCAVTLAHALKGA